MRGPYPLSPLAVDIRVPCRVRGVYCLAKEPGGPVVKVSRAEADIREELKASFPEYRAYWYETCVSSDEVYATECRLYHKYVGTTSWGKQVHPTAPARANVKCPVCGQ